MASERTGILSALKPRTPQVISRRIDQSRDLRNQKTSHLTKISHKFTAEIPGSEKTIDLNNPRNIDAKEKFLDGQRMPDVYKAGIDNQKFQYGKPEDVIQFISTNPLFRKYLIRQFNLQNSNFEMYYLTADEFNDMIVKHESLDNALTSYLKTKKYDTQPLYSHYKNYSVLMKKLRDIRKKVEQEEKSKYDMQENDEDGEDEYDEYLDENLKPVKRSFASKQLNYDKSEYTAQGKLTPARMMILWLSLFVIFLILNAVNVPFKEYGTRLLAVAMEILILYGSYKAIRWALMANQAISEES